jgi:hypothetical protein
MLLSEFATRVRNRIRDVSAQFTNIQSQLDEAISSQQQLLISKFPHFYIARDEFTAVADQETYDLPADFRSHITLRRTDLSGAPALAYVPHNLIDDYRETMGYPVDIGLRTSPYQYWTLYDDSQLIIVPAPPSTDYEYRLDYYRAHVPATADGHTVDVPVGALPYMITYVAWTLLVDDGDVNADRLKERLAHDLKLLEGFNQLGAEYIAREVRQWW